MFESLSDVYVDIPLSNISIKYTNDNYIADKVFPILKVGKMTGLYYVYDKSNLRADVSDRALGAHSQETGAGMAAKGSYVCTDHAFHTWVPFQIQEQADAALNPLIDETEALTEKLMIGKEKALATILTSSSNLTQYVALSGTTQWSDYTNSDPIGDIRTARITIHKATFKRPNTLILGKEVFDALCDHPQVIERIKYSQLGVVTAELMARLFQVDQVVIGDAGYNSAKEGQTDSLAYIWGKNAIVAFVNPTIGLKQVTLGHTVTYGTRQVLRVDTGIEALDRQATFIRVGNDNYVHKLFVAACGYLIQTAVV